MIRMGTILYIYQGESFESWGLVESLDEVV